MRVCKKLSLAFFCFFSQLYLHVLSSQSLMSIFFSVLNGRSFHILPRFLYSLLLLRQSLCYFFSNDPLVLPVCCGCFLFPLCNPSSMSYLPELRTFVAFPCSSKTFYSILKSFSSRKFLVKSLGFFLQLVNLSS